CGWVESEVPTRPGADLEAETAWGNLLPRLAPPSRKPFFLESAREAIVTGCQPAQPVKKRHCSTLRMNRGYAGTCPRAGPFPSFAPGGRHSPAILGGCGRERPRSAVDLSLRRCGGPFRPRGRSARP